MNLPFYIARRYLFAKKSHHAINVISGVSVCGVALATLALVCTLSVFNGFKDLVATLFTAFDPELKITINEGKVFDVNDKRIAAIREHPGVEIFSESLEDYAMVQYKGKQEMVIIKGVQENFSELTSINSVLLGNGEGILNDNITNYAIPGIGIASALGTGIRFLDPLEVYVPKRGERINMANPSSSLIRDLIYSSGLVFAVQQQKYDDSYILVSLDFARELFQYETEVTSVELKLCEGVDIENIKNEIQRILGDEFSVSNRYEQQSDTFRIMEVEKMVSYIFLTFILFIACFNVISSLSMLVIDKTDDIYTLRNLGATDSMISRVFLFEGLLISLSGAVLGIIFGLLLCFIQQEFGIVPLGMGDTSATFVVNAYPVSVHGMDVMIVFITVLAVSFLSVYYSVRFLNRKFLALKAQIYVEK